MFLDFILIFSGIFWIYFLIKKHKKVYFILTGPAELTWHGAHTWQCHANTRRRLRGAKDFGLAFDGPTG